MTTIQETVLQKFEQIYGEPPRILVRAPGRVNLIGEHTDYNDGFVLPLAIDRAIWIALRPVDERIVRVNLLDYEDESAHSFSLDTLEKGPHGPLEYIKGMAWALQSEGYGLHGWEGVVSGDVPIGAGLSSSAALEMAVGQAFASASGFLFDPPAMAKLGQKTENQWIGVNSGIMDQMISAAGEAGMALLIDCRSLETQLSPIPEGTVVVVLDSSTRRGLVGSKYNERREQCEAAARYFGVKALRDVDESAFEAKADGLDDLTRRRARHVITENARTLRARDAMLRGDAVTVGELMDASHESMRVDFEITTPAMDAIAACARDHAACYGARMTGGGFGGCAVALVKAEGVDDFVAEVMRCYAAQTGNTAVVYVCHATDGASVVDQ